jgi:copper transport protein
MVPADLFNWPKSLFELTTFIASFFASGAIGFRFGVLGSALRPGSGVTADERRLMEQAVARTAPLGLLGVLWDAALFVWRLPQMAAREHMSELDLLRGDPLTQIRIALLVVAIGGFTIAARRRDYGWMLAAVGVVAGALRGVFAGQWRQLVNPIHMLAGGFWIGTLFMMIAFGFSAVLSSRLQPERRGSLTARMVRGFSPLALGSVATLATFGLITAWLHLGAVDRLWTTPYGKVLLIKLGVVALVLAFGAWNWRRQKPRLGTEGAARSIRVTAIAELVFATLVLLVTSVLVVMPDARPPGQ